MTIEADLSDQLAGHHLVLDERFDAADLDRSRWIPHYLPQWAGRERSRARYRLTGSHLELFIADDQEPWLPQVAPHLRVSSLQSGCFAGPLGSTIGQHRTDDRMRVVEEQAVERLITPRYGVIEMRARWRPHPDHMVALWMIGLEDRPERSAEICICEIFGSEATARSALVGMGVHPFGDPTLSDDFEKVAADLDVSRLHDYAVVWNERQLTFHIDGRPVRRVEQAPRYPMQLMLDIYDFGAGRHRSPAEPFVVDHIRIHAPD